VVMQTVNGRVWENEVGGVGGGAQGIHVTRYPILTLHLFPPFLESLRGIYITKRYYLRNSTVLSVLKGSVWPD
jgi:hypothetical protein